MESFSKEIADAISWTCQRFSEHATHFLSTDRSYKHDYVCLGVWQQGDLGHHFGHFRRSTGCNYFITVKEVFYTHELDMTKMVLFLDFDAKSYSESDHSISTATGHACTLCSKQLSEK